MVTIFMKKNNNESQIFYFFLKEKIDLANQNKNLNFCQQKINKDVN